MRTSGLLLVLIAAGGLALSTGAARAKVWNVTKTNVTSACKGRMQSGNGQFGCSRCDAGVCRDYNCSDGSHGVHKGCKEVIIDRRKPRGDVTRPTSAGLKKTSATAPKYHRHPGNLGDLKTKAIYRHRSTGPANPNGPGPGTGPFAPPTHRAHNGGNKAKPMLRSASEHRFGSQHSQSGKH